jgi:serine protease Do
MRVRVVSLAAWRGPLLLAVLVAAFVSTPGLVRAQQSLAIQQLPDFTELVDRVGPAVVNIRTLERGRQGPSAGGPEGVLR